MTEEILVFHEGKFIGTVMTSDFPKNVTISVLNRTLNGEVYDILHIRDMDYGITIPKHIADDIRSSGDIEKVEV